MTDQGLRDALKELRTYCGKYVDDPDASEAEQLAYDDVCIQLAQILTKHPTEPVGVSDEAVEAAAEKLYKTSMSNQALRWDGSVAIPREQRPPTAQQLSQHEEIKDRFREKAAAVLEAAAPLLGTRPQPTPEAEFDPEAYEDGGTEEAQGVISSEEAAQDPWGWGVEAQQRYEAAVAQGMPRLPGDHLATHNHSGRCCCHPRGQVKLSTDHCPGCAKHGAVRPLPTREQIAEVLLYEEGSEWAENTNRHYELADAVLALFAGDKE